jgi:transcription elongation factor GreA
MEESIMMTRAGYEKLKADVEQMENVQMPAIAEKIASARAEGDLRENAEYHAQREAQGLLQAKINMLRSKLARAQIMDPARMPRDRVGFGCTVVVKDCDFGDEEEYTLVGAGEEDYNRGRILATSPMGAGLTGKKVGETAEIAAPKGKIRFEVVEIKWEE